jgi:hypothetical protein
VRVVYSPAPSDYGADLIRLVGICRACGEKNIVWLVRDHVITMATLACEFCGRREGDNKKKKSVGSTVGIAWLPGMNCFHGRVVGKNYPELAREGDLVT